MQLKLIMICVKITLSVLFMILCLDTLKVNCSSAFPTSGILVPTNITYDFSYTCQPNSAISELKSKITVPSLATCNGAYTWMNIWKFDAVIRGKAEKLTIQSRDEYTFVNGNFISPGWGHVIEGTCDGDKIYWITISTADDQKGCQSQDGLKSHTEVFAHFTFEGKCQSICGGPGSKDTYKHAITNWGLAHNTV